jgi:exopolysaccharide production protein ExoZ
MGAAAILSRRTVPLSGPLLTLGLLGFAAAALCEVTGLLYGFGAAARVAYGVFAFMVILAVVERERSGFLKVPRAMAVLGRASYSVYLVHLIGLGLAFKYLSMAIHLTPSWSLLIWALLCAAGLVSGILASIWLEQPAIRLARRWLMGAAKSAR